MSFWKFSFYLVLISGLGPVAGVYAGLMVRGPISVKVYSEGLISQDKTGYFEMATDEHSYELRILDPTGTSSRKILVASDLQAVFESLSVEATPDQQELVDRRAKEEGAYRGFGQFEAGMFPHPMGHHWDMPQALVLTYLICKRPGDCVQGGEVKEQYVPATFKGMASRMSRRVRAVLELKKGGDFTVDFWIVSPELKEGTLKDGPQSIHIGRIAGDVFEEGLPTRIVYEINAFEPGQNFVRSPVATHRFEGKAEFSPTRPSLIKAAYDDGVRVGVNDSRDQKSPFFYKLEPGESIPFPGTPSFERYKIGVSAQAALARTSGAKAGLIAVVGLLSIIPLIIFIRKNLWSIKQK